MALQDQPAANTVTDRSKDIVQVPFSLSDKQSLLSTEHNTLISLGKTLHKTPSLS